MPEDRQRVGLLVQLLVGPEGEPGEESFDVVVCTPLWLLERIKDDVLNLRHYLLVKEFHWDQVQAYIDEFLADIEAPTWEEVAQLVGRLGHWEFEDYRP